MLPLVTHPHYSFDFDPKHRFPMAKFGLIAQNLRSKDILKANNVFRPGRAKTSILSLAHCDRYLDRFIQNSMTAQEIRRLGLPWSDGLCRRTLISPNGTLLTANLALDRGIACHLAGGTHHAHRDFASGFCILNDLAITALALERQEKVNSVLIFDVDVHQGDGTASILSQESNLITCSIHCEKNFPARKAKSDVDMGVPVGMEDADYLAVVKATFGALVEEHKPDLVLYDAGVDVFHGDPLGLLQISEAGIRARDEWVLNHCRERTIPVATVIGGGYDKDRWALAKRHSIVAEAAQAVFFEGRRPSIKAQSTGHYSFP